MEIIKSNKGTDMLVLNGFTFTEHSKSKNGDKIYWRFVNRDDCNARAHTNTDLENLVLLKDARHIGHLPEHREIAARKIMQGVKRAAEDNPNEPPQKVRRKTFWLVFVVD